MRDFVLVPPENLAPALHNTQALSLLDHEKKTSANGIKMNAMAEEEESASGLRR